MKNIKINPVRTILLDMEKEVKKIREKGFSIQKTNRLLRKLGEEWAIDSARRRQKMGILFESNLITKYEKETPKSKQSKEDYLLWKIKK